MFRQTLLAGLAMASFEVATVPPTFAQTELEQTEVEPAETVDRLTPETCDRFQAGMTEAELSELLETLDIEPERNTSASGDGTLQWLDGITGAVLSIVLRGGTVSDISCFGVSPSETEAVIEHQLCSQLEMGMTLAQAREALGSEGEAVDTGDPVTAGLLWRWENPERKEVALLAFNDFGILVGSTCTIETPLVETPTTVEVEETDESN
ncbi:MAG: hypothetical protein J7642_09835 [Cyanobacteria bacterium SBC]|nr:hypothetical protein [Cyanobacteria bacterium SBC]